MQEYFGLSFVGKFVLFQSVLYQRFHCMSIVMDINLWSYFGGVCVSSLYSELMLQFQKPHVRQFAVESFGFLLRKVSCHRMC